MKTYMVVTNDKYEYPVSVELIGAKEVASFLGITEQGVRSRLHRGVKKEKYKIIIVKEKQIDDKMEYHRNYVKKWSMQRDRTEYFRELHRRKKEIINGIPV